jgi:hypothetical protein
MKPWMRRLSPARRVVWSGPYGEEFAPDKSASANQAELSTANVSSASRRNVSGAIASDKNDATSRSDDNRDEAKKENEGHKIH